MDKLIDELPLVGSWIVAAVCVWLAVKTMTDLFLQGAETELEPIFVTNKVCGSCGKTFVRLPRGARYQQDPFLGGYYWECKCGSTLYTKEGNLK